MRLQRPLWASTSTKDPAYAKLYYVEALIAPNTATTLPPETFGTYRDRGNPKVRIANDRSGTRYVFQALTELRVDQQRIWRELEEEGAAKFVGSYDRVLETLEKEKVIHAVRRSA